MLSFNDHVRQTCCHIRVANGVDVKLRELNRYTGILNVKPNANNL